MIRAKFKLISITQYGAESWNLKFDAVHETDTEENKRFTKYTPSGTLEMRCTNPSVMKNLEIGKYYYLDFSPAPES